MIPFLFSVRLVAVPLPSVVHQQEKIAVVLLMIALYCSISGRCLQYKLLLVLVVDHKYFCSCSYYSARHHAVLVPLVCHAFNFDMGGVDTDNIEKLQKRYPEKYIDEMANARLDKNG